MVFHNYIRILLKRKRFILVRLVYNYLKGLRVEKLKQEKLFATAI